MTNIDYGEYDDFLKDANKDEYIGKQNFMVSSVAHETWDDGSPRTKIKGELTSTPARAKIEITLSAVPPKSVIDAEAATWEGKKKRAIAQTIGFHKALQKLGMSVDTLKEGNEFRVEVVRNKEKFLRIVAILGAPQSGAAKRSSDSDIPF